MKGLLLVIAAIGAVLLWRARSASTTPVATNADASAGTTTINVPAQTQFVQTSFPPAAAPPPWTPTPIFSSPAPVVGPLPPVTLPAPIILSPSSPIRTIYPVGGPVYGGGANFTGGIIPSPAAIASVGSPAQLTVPLLNNPAPPPPSPAPMPITVAGGSGQSTTPPPTPPPVPITVPTVTIGGIIRPITYGGGIVRTVTL